ncbi:hypothetical protein [Streptomyces sp. NPDC002402]
MPDEERLPRGPHRDLVLALHDIYELAGKPAARTISICIRERDDLPGTLSHEGVSAVLRGVGVPRWSNLESLVRVLAEQQRVGDLDVTRVVLRIHTLWRLADGGRASSNDSTSPSDGPQDVFESALDQATTHSGTQGKQQPDEPPALAPVMRWNPRHRTLDVFDRQVAVEIFREAGGVDD